MPIMRRCVGRGLPGLAIVTLTIVTLITLGLAQPSRADAGKSSSRPLIVFAAASLKNAMDDVAQAYENSHDGADVRVSYAGSSTLARQIQAGAPADIYVSANQQWMDRLVKQGLVRKGTRYDLLGNALVLVAPKGSDTEVKLKKSVDLRSRLGKGNYLAMANTDSVPAGIYGKHALQWLGVWSQVQGHIAQSDDVRAALALVARGESPLGVVYSSDAVAEDGVRVVDTLPADSHKPIIYPAAATADSDNPRDAGFLAFLTSDTAARIFRRWGFKMVAGQ